MGGGWHHEYETELILPTGGSTEIIYQTSAGNILAFDDNGENNYTPKNGVLADLSLVSGGNYELITSDQTRYLFDPTGKMLEKSDPSGNTISFDYYVGGANDGKLERAYQGSRSLTYSYNGSGNLNLITDHTGREIELFYDINGNVERMENPLDEPYTYVYSSTTSYLTEVRDNENILLKKMTYDAFGRATMVENGAGNVLGEIVYNSDMTRQVIEAGVPSTHVYNGRNLLVEKRFACPDGSGECALVSDHTAAFRNDGVTDANNNTTDLVWSAEGTNLTQMTNALNQTTDMVYDSVNNLTQMTDARNVDTNYFFEDVNHPTFMTRMVDGLGNTTIYTPTVEGYLDMEEDENGLITHYTYDSFGQVTQIDYAFGTADETSVSYIYDSLGRLIEMTNRDGTVTKHQYDAADRVTQTTINFLAGQPQNYQDRYNLISTYEYDSAGRLVATTDTYGQTDRTEYDAAGRPFKRITNYDGTSAINTLCTPTWFQNPDPEFNICSLTEYDQFGRVSATTDAIGRVSRTFYDSLGRVLGTVTNSVNVTQASQLDGCFNLAEDREQDVCSKNEYDAMGNLIYTTDPIGRRTRTFYDALNRQVGTIQNDTGLISSINDFSTCYGLAEDRTDNLCTATEYDAVGNMIITTDVTGQRSRSVYDNLNRLTASIQNWDGTNPATIVADCAAATLPNTRTSNICTLYEYDAAGRQTVTTNALGQQSLTVYDDANRVYITVQNWDGTTSFNDHTTDCDFSSTSDQNLCSVTLYNDKGQRIQSIDGIGQPTDYTYDEVGRLVKTTRYLDGRAIETTSTYNERGNVVTQTDANGNTSTTEYDSLGRVKRTVSAEGVAVTRNYDALGRVVSTVDDLGHTITTTFDDLGRSETTTNGNSDTTINEYNVLGQRTGMIDAEGRRTEYFYDDLNRLGRTIVNVTAGGIQTADENIETETVYNVEGHRLQEIDALGRNASTTIYDDLDRPISVTNAEGETMTMSYNVLGQKISETNGENETTNYGYDGLNRQTTITYLADGTTTTYTYNRRGQKVTMVDPLGTTTYTYDDLGRMTNVTDPLGSTLVYSYNDGGQRTGLTYPDGKQVTYSYDQDNRLDTLADWTGSSASYGYDAAGRHTTTVLPNGTTMTNSYDSANRLIGRSYVGSDSSVLADFGYTLDKVGNKLTATELVVAPADFNETTAFLEQNGELVLEAESGEKGAGTTHNWTDQTLVGGMSGSDYLRVVPDIGERYGPAELPDSPSVNFNIDITNSGDYTLWVRGMAPDLGGDSIHVSLDGTHQAELTGFQSGEWTWAKLNLADGSDVSLTLSAGLHSLNLHMREDGTRIDKIIANDGTEPTGLGPPESSTTNGGGGSINQTVTYVYDGLYRHTSATYTGTFAAVYSYSYDAIGNRTGFDKTIAGVTTSTTYTHDDCQPDADLNRGWHHHQLQLGQCRAADGRIGQQRGG